MQHNLKRAGRRERVHATQPEKGAKREHVHATQSENGGKVVQEQTQTCQVSRIWREVHAFLSHSRIHAAFLKIDSFHAFSGFGSRIHPNFAQYPQLLTPWFVFSFQVMFCSTSLTESSANSRTMPRQIVRNI